MNIIGFKQDLCFPPHISVLVEIPAGLRTLTFSFPHCSNFFYYPINFPNTYISLMFNPQGDLYEFHSYLSHQKPLIQHKTITIIGSEIIFPNVYQTCGRYKLCLGDDYPIDALDNFYTLTEHIIDVLYTRPFTIVRGRIDDEIISLGEMTREIKIHHHQFHFTNYQTENCELLAKTLFPKAY